MTEEIRKLKEIIDGSDNIVFFGGAGVSTESGIPRLPQRGRTLPPAVERPARNDPEPHLLRALSREILCLLPREAPLPRREAKRRAS